MGWGACLAGLAPDNSQWMMRNFPLSSWSPECHMCPQPTGYTLYSNMAIQFRVKYSKLVIRVENDSKPYLAHFVVATLLLAWQDYSVKTEIYSASIKRSQNEREKLVAFSQKGT
jgi:hypothetical protein